MAGQPWRNAVSLLDRTLGDGLERQVAAHHERRLRNLGWERAISPGPGLWAGADPPPRPGNSLGLLIDGETALPRMAEVLMAARTQVSIAGWEITPDFALDALGPAYRAARRAGRAGGAHSGARAAVGGSPAAGLSAVAAQREGRAP